MFQCLKSGKSREATGYYLLSPVLFQWSGLRESPGYFSSLGEESTDFSIILRFLTDDSCNNCGY